MSVWNRALCVGAALVAAWGGVGFGASAYAQTWPVNPAGSLPAGPLAERIDKNGVDLHSGRLKLVLDAITIGPAGSGGLTYAHGTGWGDASAPFGVVNVSGTKTTVTLGGISEAFTLSGGAYRHDRYLPYTLSLSSGKYTYIMPDGTVAEFDAAKTAAAPWTAANGVITRLTRPDGETLYYKYKDYTGTSGSLNGKRTQRIRSIISSLGYQLYFEYASNGTAADSMTPTKVVALNNAYEYCNPDPAAANCTFANTWPTLTFTSNGNVITNAVGQTTTLTVASNTLKVSRTGRADVTYAFDGATPTSKVTSVTRGSSVYTYALTSMGSGLQRMTVTDPAPSSATATYDSYVSTGQQHSVYWLPTEYNYDPYGRLLTRIESAELAEAYLYDYDPSDPSNQAGRGNITKKGRFGAGTSRDTYYVYPSGPCTNYRTCNKPTKITDPEGKETDYTYDPESGMVTSITLPIASSTATPSNPTGGRPQTTYVYGPVTAKRKNASGVLEDFKDDAGNVVSVKRLAYSLTCNNKSTGCALTDQTKVTYTYDVNNNLQVQTETVGDGADTAAVTSTTAYAYTPLGDVYSVDGPLSGAGDTTYFNYDGLRRKTIVTGPLFTDASSATVRLFNAWNYNTNNQAVTESSGSVNTSSVYTTLTSTVTDYDTLGRAIKATTSIGGATASVVQSKYDDRDRLVCTVRRLNVGALGSEDACTATARGADGPDQITRYTYNNFNEITSIRSGETGGADDRSEIKYEAGRKVEEVDGLGRKILYIYNNYGELTVVSHPKPDGSDNESYGYDRNGRLTSYNNRAGELTTYTYDAAGWLKQVVTSTNTWEYLRDYAGRVVSARDTADVNGKVLTLYDVQGREISNTTYGGTLLYQYDAAGRRTGMTYPGPSDLVVGYEWNGDLLKRIWNTTNSTDIVAYTYDSFGRRKQKLLGGVKAIDYEYNTLSQLSALKYPNLPGSSQSGHSGHLHQLGYTYDVAGRIKTKSATESSEFLTGAGNTTDRLYAYNERNQMGAVTGSAPFTATYNNRGGLASDGITTFNYDAQNRLISTGAGATLKYDGLGRLYEVANSGGTTRFLYDGEDIIAEYGASKNLLRRFVHGPETDEPVLQYEGMAFTSTRNFFADERGSIIAVTQNAGTLLSLDKYDEYGNTTTGSRFRYTGQAYISQLGLYYYKARFYYPQLGRFLTPDPLGYDVGLNLYAYTSGDPINFTDPTGLCTDETGVEDGKPCVMTELEVLGKKAQRLVSDTVQYAAYRFGDYDFDFVAYSRAAASELFAGYMEMPGEAVVGQLYIKSASRLKSVACNCFAAGTTVKTRQGERRIEDVKVGDEVLARDEATGESAFKPVVSLIPGKTRPLWALTLRFQDGATIREETLYVTEEHPFNTAENGWVKAAELTARQTVIRAYGASASVVSVRKTERMARTYNFEVADFHTYFVGKAGVWVHNACWDALSRAAAKLDRNGLTFAGRALQKHGNRAGSAFPKLTGSARDLNAAGQNIVDDILTTPGTIQRGNRFGGVDVISPGGRGVRYGRDGGMMGFLEP